MGAVSRQPHCPGAGALREQRRPRAMRAPAIGAVASSLRGFYPMKHAGRHPA